MAGESEPTRDGVLSKDSRSREAAKLLGDGIRGRANGRADFENVEVGEVA
jgi:hypothetical protein